MFIMENKKPRNQRPPLRVPYDEQTGRYGPLDPMRGPIKDAPLGIESCGITSVEVEGGDDVDGLKQAD
jgi:hypothetical protein